MAWIDPYNKDKLPPRIDVNKELMTVKGDVEEQVARTMLGRFLRYNLQFSVYLLTGMFLAPFQACIIEGWFKKNYSLACWGRGCAKSTLIGLFCVLYAIFNPGTRILIVSSNFRSARRILDTLDLVARQPKGALLRQCFAKDMSRRNDEFKLEFLNGSSIVCLPLANGEGLRGQRANVLIVDEALLVSRQIIENVLMPFLAAKGQDVTTEQIRIRQKEDGLIRMGLLKEEDRTKFKSKNKMILLSSASFHGEYFHEVYTTYLAKIQNIRGSKDTEAKEKEDDDLSHFVSQLSYEVIQELAPEILDQGLIKEIQSGSVPQSVIDREYRALFVQDSGGYYRMSHMKACTIEDGNVPCIEIVGDPDAEYVVGLDPNASDKEYNDYFAISVLKIITKGERKIGMLVHSYAAAGVTLKDHYEYFLYIMQHFNVVYVAFDASQGKIMDFINACNEAEIFKKAKISLSPIEADFGTQHQSEIIKQIRKSYSKESNRIVQQQNFHPAFQGAAADYLQACITFGHIVFAGHALAVEGMAAALSEQDIGGIHKRHKQFADEKDGNPIYSFIERQDYLIDLTKQQLAIVVVGVSSHGVRNFDIPNIFKKSKNINRPRKDLFSSLMLANWGLKLFVEAMALPPEEDAPATFVPFVAGAKR